MEWREYIVRDPEVMLGKPCIRGARLTVEFILEQLGNGWAQDDLVNTYKLTAAQVQAAQACIYTFMPAKNAPARRPELISTRSGAGLPRHFQPLS